MSSSRIETVDNYRDNILTFKVQKRLIFFTDLNKRNNNVRYLYTHILCSKKSVALLQIIYTASINNG